MLECRLVREPTVPLEAEVLCPDVVEGKDLDAIRALRLFHGKRPCTVGDFFEVTGAPSDRLRIVGDLKKVRWIGRSMTKGSIEITGDVGMHLGAHMKGGTIHVRGNVSDWLGAEMRGGLIVVHGDAGGQVGAAYRGDRFGMNRGTIWVRGNAGLEVGMRMRRGLIVIGGMVRDFAGLEMKGGTLVLLGGAELRTGAWMRRGTIIALHPIKLMPTFRPSGTYSPTFLAVLTRYLRSLDVDLPVDLSAHIYQRWIGDSAALGKGELFLLAR
ncbi:MAG: tungsten-containing formylmethanofuran dehydrogenase 2 subunit C [Pirellulaceae bacterium]|nr:MAG: tungsten-containing formylmethanofuran dehydrogenase 2 subunit C [Pirellulaceae bacterium]